MKEKETINVNEIPEDEEKQGTPVVDGKDDDEEKPEPPVFDGKDDDEEKPEPPTFDGKDDDEEKPEPPTFDGKDDDEEKPEPPVFNGKDNGYNDTNDLTKTSTTTTTTTTTTTNSIFGFVQSLFSNVVQSWGGFNWFSNRTFMPTFGWGSQQPMRGSQQPMGPQPRNQGIFGGFFGNIINYGMSMFSSSSQTTTTTTSEVKTVTLNEGGDKEVWLSNDSEDVAINATNTTGNNILAGNNKNNQIFGGSGTNNMWGGGGKTNDYLFGGEGQNTFWYGKGEGVDLIENTKKGDTINLYNITLGDISNLEITDSSITVVIGENEGIGVSSSDEVSPTFKLASGESYNYNRSSAEWQKA